MYISRVGNEDWVLGDVVGSVLVLYLYIIYSEAP